uniref:hypothetical protein n=1 Tax=Candidatus Electronema sp. TaxID=2698783 RepID=UPI004056021C
MKRLEEEGRLYFTQNNIREKYYLSERTEKGKQLPNVWNDISIASGNEKLGYPTQKPVELPGQTHDFYI